MYYRDIYYLDAQPKKKKKNSIRPTTLALNNNFSLFIKYLFFYDKEHKE